MLEHIMYTRLYNYLQENTILYSKQLGFQTGHSTDYAMIQLVEQIYENSEQNKYTLGVFFNLAKAFDMVDHKILLTLFRMGFSGAAHRWGGCKKYHTYPAMMKLGTVIPCLTKIQKVYESRDTPLEFC